MLETSKTQRSTFFVTGPQKEYWSFSFHSFFYDCKLCGLGTLSAFRSVGFIMIISVICLYCRNMFSRPGNREADLIITQKGTPFRSRFRCKEQLHSAWIHLSQDFHYCLCTKQFKKAGRTCQAVPQQTQYFYFYVSKLIFWSCPWFALTQSCFFFSWFL